MSVLKTPEAVPSRVLAVFDFLRSEGHGPVARERLEAMLSPIALRGARGSGNMVGQVVNECLKMRLVTEAKKGLTVSKKTLDLCDEHDLGDGGLRGPLIALLTDPRNEENHDLCMLLAWLLFQDPVTFRGDFDGMQKALRDSCGSGRLGVTADLTHDDLYYWSRHLGFTWAYVREQSGPTRYLMPDPYTYLSLALPKLFAAAKADELPVGEMLELLGERCPVFQTGAFAKRVVSDCKISAGEEIAPAVAFALNRMDHAGLLKMETRSDAQGLTTRYGGAESRRWTHIVWQRTNEVT